MSGFDDAIDDLYRLEPAAFTGARNALAKQARGAEAAAIRSLVKPPLAAWAVNQVYWRDRVAFDRLVKAAEAVRAAHRRLVGGEAADVAGAEAAHREALAVAADAARAALAGAGQSASPAVLASVTDTLRALPSADPFGRLTRALTPASGFDAFAGVAAVAPRATPRAAPPPLRLQKGAGAAAAARDKAKERTRVAKELAGATEAVRKAEAALKGLTQGITAAERECKRRQTALDEAAAKLRALTADLQAARHAVEDATHERDRLRRRVEALDS